MATPERRPPLSLVACVGRVLRGDLLPIRRGVVLLQQRLGLLDLRLVLVEDLAHVTRLRAGELRPCWRRRSPRSVGVRDARVLRAAPASGSASLSICSSIWSRACCGVKWACLRNCWNFFWPPNCCLMICLQLVRDLAVGERDPALLAPRRAPSATAARRDIAESRERRVLGARTAAGTLAWPCRRGRLLAARVEVRGRDVCRPARPGPRRRPPRARSGCRSPARSRRPRRTRPGTRPRDRHDDPPVVRDPRAQEAGA